METAATMNLVNDCFVGLYRSLVQYSMEVSPWTAKESCGLREAVESLAQRQQSDAKKLAELLVDAGEAIDYSYYPHEFTSLHFVSLKYLASRMVDGQRELVASLEAAVNGLAESPARELLSAVCSSQREGLDDLEKAAAAVVQS
ncbi:MAG: hypothetical protein R3C18_26745 [Planctomycetaceae bacterium]